MVLNNNRNNSTVNARDLHNQLGIGREFAKWIEEKILNYGFEEGADFSSKMTKTKGRPAKDYFLTLSTAKELAMVQNNDAGRLARKYFIAIENAYKNREEWNYDIVNKELLNSKNIINNK